MPSSTISQPLYRPMRQIRQTRAFYRFLFRGLRLPFWMADTITKGMKYVWNPSQGRLREEFAARLGCGGEAERLEADRAHARKVAALLCEACEAPLHSVRRKLCPPCRLRRRR